MTRDASHWRPGTTPAALGRRAGIIRTLRAFLDARGVLEVDTPLLAPVGATDPLLASIPAFPFDDERRWYLQTSPEFALKRLLAAGSGPIYQLGKAFRRGEAGARHNPEFTMLEWYRPGFELPQLMREVAELVGAVLGERSVTRHTYREAFRERLGLDPFTAEPDDLRGAARALGADTDAGWDRDALLDFLFGTAVEPHLGLGTLAFVTGFPAGRAALARMAIDADGTVVADRFELYVEGVELANGYNELTDAEELRARMRADNAARQALGLDAMPIDERLLTALPLIPPCAGVALGVDRLVMLAQGETRIDAVIAFACDRA